jgi:hypothetical protein
MQVDSIRGYRFGPDAADCPAALDQAVNEREIV